MRASEEAPDPAQVQSGEEMYGFIDAHLNGHQRAPRNAGLPPEERRLHGPAGQRIPDGGLERPLPSSIFAAEGRCQGVTDLAEHASRRIAAGEP